MIETEEKVEPDFYALIGISPSAPPDEVRRAYGEKAQAAMSDRPQFEALGQAFEILKDPAKRAAYDRRRQQAQVHAPKGEATRMTIGSEATMAMPSSSGATVMGNRTVSPQGDGRTQAFSLPTVCAIALSPCPLLSRAVLPDDGFCPECGVLVGAPLGEALSERVLPKLIDATGREFPLRAGENTVGREGADVMLPDKTVSRRHARLVVEESGTVWLEDTGSTNGTRRAGSPLPAGQRTSLADKMPVQFGSVKLTISIPDNGATLLALPLPAASEEAQNALLAALPAPSDSASARLVGKDGKNYVLTDTRTTFGRKSGNTIVLTGDSFVSGSHAEIVYVDDRFQLTDLGSTNGTKLNGRKLLPNAPLVLDDGDEVTLGQTSFLFRASAGEAH